MNNQMLTNSRGGQLEGCSFHAEFALALISAVGGCLAWPCFRPKDDRASTATTKAGALDQCSSVLNPCNRRFILYTIYDILKYYILIY